MIDSITTELCIVFGFMSMLSVNKRQYCSSGTKLWEVKKRIIARSIYIRYMILREHYRNRLKIEIAIFSIL